MSLLGRLLRQALVALLGFGAGAVFLFVVFIRQGPPLEAWHEVVLESEYTVDHPDVESFADYLALEERLFSELESRIYAKTPTGPRYALNRYSSGSLADPRGFERDWNATFEWPVEKPRGGVLLLHGMSDGPYSLRALGETLHARGYWVVGLRYPGNGTLPSALRTATWEDMAAAVALAARHLGEVAGAGGVHMVGYSTGAPLALDYALEVADGAPGPMPASLLLVSPAIAISPAAAGASWLQLASSIPGLERLAWTQVLPEFDPFKYNSFAVNAGDQVHRLTRQLVREIESRAAATPIEDFPPTLVLLSTVDATVSAEAVIDHLLEHLAPEGHELVLFDVNRSQVKASLMVSDPGPLTERLLSDPGIPFHLSLLANESPASAAVVELRKTAFHAEVTRRPLGLSWPLGVVSLSHVALPFPSDDPLYGNRPPDSEDVLHLGEIAFWGERGLLRFPADWLGRLRHNPFYDYLEERSVGWIEARSAP